VASLPGAVIGGIFVQVIEKYTDAVTKEIVAVLHSPIELEPWTIYGIVLVLLIYLMPSGIAGGITSLAAHLRRH
jgi:branched-chain amino acid transport system permease protein